MRQLIFLRLLVLLGLVAAQLLTISDTNDTQFVPTGQRMSPFRSTIATYRGRNTSPAGWCATPASPPVPPYRKGHIIPTTWLEMHFPASLGCLVRLIMEFAPEGGTAPWVVILAFACLSCLALLSPVVSYLELRSVRYDRGLYWMQMVLVKASCYLVQLPPFVCVFFFLCAVVSEARWPSRLVSAALLVRPWTAAGS